MKRLANEIALPLSCIFGESLRSGRVPRQWKLAHVCPIHKSGSKLLARNYRPVSLTSVVAKCMEQLLRSALFDHLQENRLLTPRQYGFVPGVSTTVQLLRVLDGWTEALNDGEEVDVIYLEFQKAFDKVPHYRLIEKVRSFQILPGVVAWLSDFLTGRGQRVCVGGSSSEVVDVTSGIPQGTVLGPVLFLLYVNDLPDAISSSLYMFADDTKLFRTIKGELDVTELQKDLNELERWTEKWLLFFNTSKCKHMTLGGTLGGTRDYYIGNQSVVGVDQEKDLGVIFDSGLRFDAHVGAVVNKANSLSFLLLRTFSFDDLSMFPVLFNAIVRSHLEYAMQVWSPYLMRHIDQIEKVQRRATKRLKALRGLPYVERLRQLKQYSLSYRRVRGDMIMTFKILRGDFGVGVAPDLVLAGSISGRTTRGHSLKLFKRPARLDVRKYCFPLRVVDSWNSLPESVIESPSLNTFKRRLDDHWQEYHYALRFTGTG